MLNLYLGDSTPAELLPVVLLTRLERRPLVPAGWQATSAGLEATPSHTGWLAGFFVLELWAYVRLVGG